MTIKDIAFSIHPTIKVKIYTIDEMDLIFQGTADELTLNHEINQNKEIVSLWISEQGYIKLYIIEK